MGTGGGFGGSGRERVGLSQHIQIMSPQVAGLGQAKGLFPQLCSRQTAERDLPGVFSKVAAGPQRYTGGTQLSERGGWRVRSAQTHRTVLGRAGRTLAVERELATLTLLSTVEYHLCTPLT